MATITINGTVCTFEGKKMILEVANDNGVEIPHYCYHPGLSIVASCRICLAEVEQPNPRNDNKPELIPKLMPACQTPAVDGMIVDTESPKSVANQKAVMEYLLINHPLDCPVCDQAGECGLQDYSYRYGRSESRFEDQKIKQATKDIGPHVKLYADRCIMCTRCVRFTREVSGTGEISVFGRGNKEQIDVFPGKPLDNELSGNVVDICPVGALLDKDFLFTQRVWNLTRTPSIDGITASGDNIWIEHNNGRIYRVKPRANLEVNKWWISDEIRFGWKFVHDERRMTMPRRQQYGTAVETEWKRAYSDVRDGLKSAAAGGPGAIALMVSPMLSCEDAYLLGLMARAIDSEAVLAVGPVPVEGEDKTFPGEYTVRAEKCPNSRGVKRALEMVGDVVDYATLVEQLSDKKSPVQAVVLTGNYPSSWITAELTKAVGKKFSVLIDTLDSDFAGKASVVLPSVTWAEKSGTFENVGGRLQAFEQAIPLVEFARSEGQIALDIAATFGHSAPQQFNAAQVREQMGGAFVEQVQYPATDAALEPDMAYVEF
jgi:NADH-quinone oxidoreductase subunit G